MPPSARMATFTDEEIDQLFDSSNTIIDSIITSQSNPVQTVGKSAIPAGITKAKTDAWEKAIRDQIAESDAEHTKAITPEAGPKDSGSGEAQATQQSQNPVTENQPSKNLLASIDRLASKTYEPGLKKGSTSLLQSQDQQNGSPGPRNPLPPQGNLPSSQATGVNSPYAGGIAASPQHRGATQHVPQSLSSPPSLSASVGTAPISADSVSEMRQMLEAIIVRMNKIECTLDSILKQTAGVAGIKNDLQLVKVSVATIEGSISMIKLMDPGNANISSLTELRASSRQTPVAVCGRGRPEDSLLADGSMGIDKLGRPVKDMRDLVTKPPNDGKDLMLEKETLAALIKSRPMQPAAAKRLLARLDNCAGMDDIKKLKRAVLNS
uniref:Phosphoprotein n=1 Tax=Avulavirus sp. TaxID=2493083 RepID=A0A481XX58_9MONO|nr:P [Avulavirus sp.] [Avulavirus sp.]